MSVCCECCVLSGRGLCDELITRPEESYRLWCVVVCDLETSRMRRPWPTGGGGVEGLSRQKNKQIKKVSRPGLPQTDTHDYTHSLFHMITSHDGTYLCYRMIHRGHIKVIVTCRKVSVGLNSSSVNANTRRTGSLYFHEQIYKPRM